MEEFLFKTFGCSFAKQKNIDGLRRFYSQSAYCLDANDQLIGLACREAKKSEISLGEEFQHLQYLNINGNEALQRIAITATMPDLLHLDLTDNALSHLRFMTAAAAMPKLKHLDISRNNLEQLVLPSLPELWFMDISKNQIGSLMVDAPKLQYAYLPDNQLAELNFQSTPRQLAVLHVKNNKLEELPQNITSFDSLNALFLHGNPLPALPKELISKAENGNSYREVWDYLQELGGGTLINTRVKLIIVGNGRVGKTSMFRRLADQPFDKYEPFTHGVQIGGLNKKNLPEVKTDELNLQVWDFGGQEIFYATHQFFLSDEAVYILAWTDKENVNPYKERDKETLPFDEKWRSCEYWLENIRLRAETSPILMVQTHSDVIQYRRSSDPTWERPPYQALNLDFSAARDFGLPELRSYLSNHLNNKIPMLGQEFPVSYETSIQLIENLKDEQPTITYERFLKVCSEAGIQEGGEQTLLEYLVKSGVVVYFDKPVLREIIYIDPNWLTQQVYLLINNELGPLKGRIDQAYLERLLPSPKYDEKTRSQFVELLKSFELIFKPRGESFYIAPQYLPEKLESNEQKFHDSILRTLELAFVFRFPKFLPDNVMINFLSRYGPFSDDVYWKNGISFSSQQGAQCIVHFEEASHNLKVYSKADQPSQMLQREICEAFVELSRNANAEISLDGQVFASWQELEKHAKLTPVNPEQQFFATDGVTPLLLKDFALFFDKEFHHLQREEKSLPMETQEDKFEEIREAVGRNELKEAIEALLRQDLETYKDSILQLQQQFYAWQQKNMAGTFYTNEENIERNRISQSLLNLITAIESGTAVPKLESVIIKTPQRASKIYFSYAWGDQEASGADHEKMVDRLYDALKEDGFNVLRDSMNIDYGGFISQYMKELGKGDLIMIFVSDKYARSPYCMFELYEIARNSKFEKTTFGDRVLIIPIERIRFDDPDVLEQYFDYWERQLNKWKKLMERRLDQSTGSTYARYENTKVIAQNLGNLVDWLIDINSGSLSLLSENDFQLVKDTIKKRLADES